MRRILAALLFAVTFSAHAQFNPSEMITERADHLRAMASAARWEGCMFSAIALISKNEDGTVSYEGYDAIRTSCLQLTAYVERDLTWRTPEMVKFIGYLIKPIDASLQKIFVVN